MGISWGKAEKNESLEGCLRREIREEMGIEIDIHGLFSDPIRYAALDEKVYVIYPFLCHYISGEIEGLPYAWVTPEEMDIYNMVPADVRFVQELKTSV